MHPTVNSDESVTPNRFTHINWYSDNVSQHRKEQTYESKNAQTKNERTHLSQNAAPLSTYATTTPLDWHIANRERRTNDTIDHQDVPDNLGRIKQKHKGIDTRNIDPLRRYQPDTVDDNSTKTHLWCVRFRKKKECPELLGRPTRRLLERIKKRGKEGEVHEAAVSGPSHRESISCRGDPRKSKKKRKQDVAVEGTDKISEKARREKRERRERRKLEKEREKMEKESEVRREEEREEEVAIAKEGKEEDREWDEKEIAKMQKKEREKREKESEERERDERRERRKREREILGMQLMARDEGFIRDRVLEKPPPDLTKTCCYLCAQNTLAIAAATAKATEQSDKCIQVSLHEFLAETPTLDRSCSPILLMRTVQSYVKVKTRETSTLCPGTSWKEEKPNTERKKFRLFPRLTRTKCPAGQNAACETDKLPKSDNAEKREPKNERCCREKTQSRRI